MDNDKISRQALLNEINEEIEYGEEHFRPENEQINKGLKIARKLVKAAPTIEAEPANGWISVEDRLPEYDKTVLVVNEDGYMHTAVRIKGSIAMIDEWQIKFGVYFMENDVWDEDEQGKITHWRLLPEPPKGE